MRKESESVRAAKFIEANKHRMSRRDIAKHLYNTTELAGSTIQHLCTKILNPLPDTTLGVITTKKKKESNLYKGRPRSFFRIDDSKLYVEF